MVKKNKKKYQDESQYDPKIHHRTKGGLGFGMKRGAKTNEGETSGLHLCRVFGWDIPEDLKEKAKKYGIVE